ncbi:hypothetical protein SDC9_159569 [bioreactor metagenome]|uniref:Uncharacterized protein n=1 Tax=bioreactor metagenome TaxID=1076179 RepID=A0A645FCZ2_9ZZZZ
MIGEEKEVPLFVVILPHADRTDEAEPMAHRSGFVLLSALGPNELK